MRRAADEHGHGGFGTSPTDCTRQVTNSMGAVRDEVAVFAVMRGMEAPDEFLEIACAEARAIHLHLEVLPAIACIEDAALDAGVPAGTASRSSQALPSRPRPSSMSRTRSQLAGSASQKQLRT